MAVARGSERGRRRLGQRAAESRQSQGYSTGLIPIAAKNERGDGEIVGLGETARRILGHLLGNGVEKIRSPVATIPPGPGEGIAR